MYSHVYCYCIEAEAALNELAPHSTVQYVQYEQTDGMYSVHSIYIMYGSYGRICTDRAVLLVCTHVRRYACT